MDPFSRLGDFEVAHLVEFLFPTDIIRLQLVSRSWRAILNSSYISRIAMLHHFPYVSQSRDLRDSHTRGDTSPKVDVTLLWRRAVYQYHTRRIGQPTKMHQVFLDYTDLLLEWDVAGGRVAWISDNRGDRVLRSKSLEGEDEGVVMDIDLAAEWFEEDERGMTGYLRVVALKIVKGLAILSLEYPVDWRTPIHSNTTEEERFIVVDLPSGTLAWKHRMHPQQTIFGDLEWSEDKLFYLRRTPIHEFTGLDTPARSLVHFVIHDMFTGAITLEIPLENGNDLVAYKSLMYDIMVVDRPLKHFILVRDHCRSPWRMDLMATIYTLSGKIVGKFPIHPEDITSRDGNIMRSIFLDLTHRHDVFNVTETFYCDFNEHYSARNGVKGHKFPMKTVAFNSWCIYPCRDKGFTIEQRRYESPVVGREALSYKEKGEDTTATSRFDILFSMLDVGVICYDAGIMEIGVDVGIYEEQRSEEQNFSGVICHKQVARRKISDKRLVNRPNSNNGLVKNLAMTFNIDGETSGDTKEEEEIQIARFDQEKGLLVKGVVHNDYWFCVEWLDRYLTFHTSWRPEGSGTEISGILILDFHPPW